MPGTRQDVVDVIKSWKGLKEKDGSFKPIIDIYNSILPLPRNYRLKYTDAWGAGAVSAAYFQAEASRIFPSECNNEMMVIKAQQMDIWLEHCLYIPKIADVCFYDKDGDDVSQCNTIPDGVGIVVSVNRTAKTFVVMEGNKNSSVGTRTLSCSSKSLRGFISPVFEEDFINAPEVKPVKKIITTEDTPTVSTTPKQVVGTGILSKVAAGSVLNLNQTPMYASASTQSISAYKTGKYYIWSVDTVNGRVRITNAKSNVGVKGQVTGWIDVTVAITLITESTPTTLSASTPTYQVDAVYVVQFDDVVVREGPGTGYDKVGYAKLTANAKKYDKNKSGCLNRGAKVTCLEVKVVGTNVWIRIPSGWVAAYHDKKFYVK